MTTKAAFAALALGVTTAVSAYPVAGADVERGRYLATIMVCGDCHTGGSLMGQPDPARYLAGSEVGFEVPGLGIFYPPNLTSDADTGLGTWSEDEIVTALRTGVRPDGRQLAPIMPWPYFQHLTDEDARDLAAFIKSLPPVRFDTPGPFGPGEPATAPYLTLKLPEGQSKPKTG